MTSEVTGIIWSRHYKGTSVVGNGEVVCLGIIVQSKKNNNKPIGVKVSWVPCLYLGLDSF